MMLLSRRIISPCSLFYKGTLRLLIHNYLYAILAIVIFSSSLYAIDWNRKNCNQSVKSPFLPSYEPSLPTVAASCFRSPYTTPLSHSLPLTPGIPLKRLDDCVGFANTLQSANDTPRSIVDNQQNENTVRFHTYWSVTKHSMRNESAQLLTMIRSFAATQQTRLVVWVSDQEHETLLLHSETWLIAKSHMKEQLTCRKLTDVLDEDLTLPDSHIINDHMGMQVLQKYGGVWFHPSMIFVRSWSPLIGEKEWMIQHNCEATHLGQETLFNAKSSVMHFFANSTSLCQLLASTSEKLSADKSSGFGTIYKDTYRLLMANGVQPFSILPWCFMNAMNGCTEDQSIQLFKQLGNNNITMPSAFALQYDSNDWTPASDTLFGYLDNSHRSILGW